MGVWNYDPISRGLKLYLLLCAGNAERPVWNYDPISRGLKPYQSMPSTIPIEAVFGTMTRFLGD